MTKEEIIAEINNREDWYPKSYAGFLFAIYVQGMGPAKASKEIPFAMSYMLLYQNRNRRDHWDWFWNIGNMAEKREEILAKTVSDEEFADNFYEEWQETYQKFISVFNVVKNVDLFSQEDVLRDNFNTLYSAVVDQAAYGFIVDAFLTAEDDDWLVVEIKKELGDKATPEIIAALTAPVSHSFVGEFDIRLCNLARAIQKGDQVEKETEKIIADYFWIRANYLDYARITPEQVVEEAQDLLLKPIVTEDTPAKNRKEKDRLLQLLNVSGRLMRILHISELFTQIQDRRKECVLRSNTLFYELLEVVAKRKGVDKTLLFYSTPEEFFSFLKGGPLPTSLIEKRINEGVLILFSQGVTHFLYKEEIDSKIKAENLFPSLKDIQFLKGAIAFKGNVKGEVWVLRNTSDIAKFPEGGILVANQTTPEFVPAMKKAAAIITDQGGITCHAAIVSRELRKPCIIGVKNATKVLKNGDLVEVDAEKGIVKILQ